MKLITLSSSFSPALGVVTLLVFAITLIFGVGKGSKDASKNGAFFAGLFIASFILAVTNAVVLIVQ